jgi:hypothetical protein
MDGLIATGGDDGGVKIQNVKQIIENKVLN